MLQVIIVMDPAAAGKPRLPIIRHSTDIKVPPREKRYVFDKAYDGNTDNRTLYNGVVKASLLCCFFFLYDDWCNLCVIVVHDTMKPRPICSLLSILVCI